MIRLLKDYFDRQGNRYKVLSFNGEKYACQSYVNGICSFLSPNELFPSPPLKHTKTKFTDLIPKKQQAPVVEVLKSEPPKASTANKASKPTYSEPVYEPSYESESATDFNKPIKVEIQKQKVLKDNIEETANNDFYADF